ncbi:MAG: hypothetical protein HOW73_39860 [Polyangiaceae bacterium]|nr:hypothetical protein [Polyangiaceae bacterium]
MQKGSGTSALVAVERRIGGEIESTLRKRNPIEPRLAGAARAIAPHSVQVRTLLASALKELVKVDAFDRELYGAGMRALAENGDKKLGALLASALKTEDFGGLPALSAACFVQDPALGPSLARAAACSKTQLAFAGEVARLFRGEPTGPRLFSLAARIKEAHRIALSIELLLPLCLRQHEVSEKACAGLGDALHVLRGSERHLGRWLLMAEIAHRGGDPRPLKEAIERTTTGPDSSRAAWSLVVWALDPNRGTGGTRPTSELVARLSHRPSADRDTGFLFRMAHARVEVARPMLEALARTKPLGDDVALRAAFLLAKNFDRSEFLREVIDSSETSARDDIRGLAAAALWDLGDRERALGVASTLAESPDLAALAWGALVTTAANGSGGKRSGDVLTETAFRRVQLGWIE